MSKYLKIHVTQSELDMCKKYTRVLLFHQACFVNIFHFSSIIIGTLSSQFKVSFHNNCKPILPRIVWALTNRNENLTNSPGQES